MNELRVKCPSCNKIRFYPYTYLKPAIIHCECGKKYEVGNEMSQENKPQEIKITLEISLKIDPSIAKNIKIVSPTNEPYQTR